MATINDKLEFEIKSIFDNTGFKQFLSNLKSISGVAKSMGSSLGVSTSNIDEAMQSLGNNDEVIKSIPQLNAAAAKSFERLETSMVKTGLASKDELWSVFSKEGQKALSDLKGFDVSQEFAKKYVGVKGFQNMFPDATSQKNAIPLITKFNEQFKELAENGGFVRKDMSIVSESINAASQFFKQGGKNAGDFFKDYITDSSKFNKATAERTQKITEFFDKYEFGFLTMQFVSMAASRVIQTVMTKTIGVFTGLSQNSSEASQAITALSANMTLLQYTVGEALGTALIPMLPTIIDLITSIADWVEQNPKLVAGILTMSLALFSFFIVLASVYALTNALPKVLLTLGKMFGLVSGDAGTLVSGAFSKLGSTLLWLVALVIVLKAMWETNFAGIRDVTNETLGGLKTVVEDTTNNIGTIFDDLFNFLKATFKGNTGEMGYYIGKFSVDLVNSLIKLVLGVVAIALKILGFLATVFRNIGLIITKAIFGVLSTVGIEVKKWINEDIVKPIVDGINKLLEGVGLKPITFNLDASIKNEESLKKKIDGFFDNTMSVNIADVVDLNKLDDVFTKLDDRASEIISTIPGKAKEVSDSLEETKMTTQEVVDKINSGGGLTDSFENLGANVFPVFKTATEEISTALSGEGGVISQFDALQSSIAGEAGLTSSFEGVNTALSGEAGLKSAMVDTSDITKNTLLPALDDTISKNEAVATSFDRAAASASKYAKAARDAAKAKSESSTSDEYYRWI